MMRDLHLGAPLLPPYIGRRRLTASPRQLIGRELLSSEYTAVTVFAAVLVAEKQGCDRHPKENIEHAECSVEKQHFSTVFATINNYVSHRIVKMSNKLQ